jgi:hypothetical protein
MNQGAQVELNVGLPDEPEDQVAKDGEEPNRECQDFCVRGD